MKSKFKKCFQKYTSMKMIWCLSFWLLGAVASPLESPIPAVKPEYLNMLLQESRYDEFSYLMGIGNPELVYSKGGERSGDEAMINEGLVEGDLLLTPQEREQGRQGLNFGRNTVSELEQESNRNDFMWTSSQEEEEARQGLNFTKHKHSKWETRSVVPYVISSNYSSAERTIILKAIAMWNEVIDCVQYKPHEALDKDYVFIFPGSGCYSHYGRIGGQQPLSLNGEGCLENKQITHELQHAVGFAHEHNRDDRDEFIKILWENIPEYLKGIFDKNNKSDYDLQGPYDYYSVMHYPARFRGWSKPVFEVLKNVDTEIVGNGYGLSSGDINKINEQYC